MYSCNQLQNTALQPNTNAELGFKNNSKNFSENHLNLHKNNLDYHVSDVVKTNYYNILDNCLGSSDKQQVPVSSCCVSPSVSTPRTSGYGLQPPDITGLPQPPGFQADTWIDNNCHLENAKLRNFDDPVPIPTTSIPNNYMNGNSGMDTLGQHKGSPQRIPPIAHQPPHLPYPQQQQLQTSANQQQHLLNSAAQQHKNSQYCTQLPDSPPDSGSEPYSPPNGDNQNDHQQTNLSYCSNVKSSMNHVPNMSQQQGPQGGVYMNPPSHSSVSPPHTQVSPATHPHAPPNMYSVPRPQHNGYMPNMGAEPPKLNHPPSAGSVPAVTLNPQMLPYVTQMNNINNQPNKKRKFSDSPNNTVTPGVLNSMGIPHLNIKPEPGLLPDCDDDPYPYDFCGSEMSGSFLDGSYQVIKWQMFQPKNWATLLDQHYKPLPAPSYRVDADKGFNFAVPDDAFVCQKKNHFQVTCHIEMHGSPKFVKTTEGAVKPVDNFYLHFHGVKMESPSQNIKVEQSQSDRSKKPFYPVRVDLPPEQVTKVTVGRLHFSETTTNNMRKKGKPNPDQRYFLLVVSLHAHSGDETFVVASQCSERIIVRASNPGQFDQDVDVTWQKGHTSDTVYHAGRVGINTDRPDEPLTVHGNIKLTGHIIQPSDKRIKTDIKELDPKEQLKNISSIKVYNYGYDNQYADVIGLTPEQLKDTGVIAQELREVLPDAVRETGDLILADGKTIDNLQVVNKDRIYMENVGAVKELCKVTDKLENRINELEFMNKKLTKLNHCKGSIKSTCSTMSLSTCSTISQTSSIPRLHSTKWDKEFNKENLNKESKELENAEKKDKSEKKSHSHHHHHHRHHRHHSHQNRQQTLPPQEEGLCSNRFIQVTIVILVLVMAFCLISITTLYIMERQEPNSPHIVNFVNQTSNTTDNPVITRFNSEGTTTPVILPTGPVPLIQPRCEREPSSCNICWCHPQTTTTTTTTTTIKQDDYHEDDGNSSKTALDTKGPGLSSKTTPDPKGPGYTVKSRHPNVHNEIDKTNVSVRLPGERYDVYNRLGRRYDVDPQASVVNQQSNDTPKDEKPVVMVQDNFQGRKRRSISSVKEKADLIIVELNKTIDKEYCTNKECQDGYGANFTYQIPISPYFGLNMVTLLFDLSSNLEVTLCNYYQEMECSEKSKNLKPVEHKEHGWNLPVGHFKITYYLFRVSNTMQEEVCNCTESELGSSFGEYWLHFHRELDSSCHDSWKTRMPVE